MALKMERRDGIGERQILTGMLVSRAVLGPIAANWQPGLFPSRMGNLLAGWAVSHYEKYKTPPGKDIISYFDGWAATAKDAETVSAVEGLLATLSDEYERLKKSVSPKYLLDLAARLFNRNRMVDLKLAIEADIEGNDVERALSRVDSFRRVEVGLGCGLIPLSDEESMAAALEEETAPLIVYPDALGNFFGPALGRDRFIAFLGKEKIGKSFWLMDLAVTGVEQERNVAFFETGDNSQDQVLLRLAARVAGRSVKPSRYEWPVHMESPGGDELPIMRKEWREDYERMSLDEAMGALRGLGGDSPGRFRLSCHPNSSISVAGIESILEGWTRDGWQPDVVVIDYADILAANNSREEGRDVINTTWKAMRALSQRLHCLVVTATQSDTPSYNVRTLSRENFSEDKRKLSHVNGLVGLNQTAKEKAEGIYRLNWVVNRELDYSEKKCVWCASCLPVARPAVLSTF